MTLLEFIFGVRFVKYVGSKNRHAKELLPLMLRDRQPDQWWVEPFVGGFNMIDKVSGNRLANDSHYWLIELFKSVQSGWQPPTTISESLYQTVRNTKYIFNPALVGFIGFGASYSGKWFGGYARDKAGKRNYAAESSRNLLKQAQSLKDVLIYNRHYQSLPIPPESIIYADPPYSNTLQYADKFDSTEFWQWAECMSLLGHKVFVSEYTAPKYWKSVWSKRVNNTLVQATGSKQGTEHLFVFDPLPF